MQLGQDDIGDVSLAGPIILLVGLLGIGGLLFYLAKKGDDRYDESNNDAVNRVRNVIADIEADFELEDSDFED